MYEAIAKYSKTIEIYSRGSAGGEVQGQGPRRFECGEGHLLWDVAPLTQGRRTRCVLTIGQEIEAETAL